MISIIIPVYKVEKYLRRCLNSILLQTYSEWECILVDDGSPDESGKICDEFVYKDARFKVVHKENGGVSSARNKGLDLAKGEWITFIDSDDYVTPDWLASIDYHIHQHKKADCYMWGYYINRNVSKEFKPIIPSGKEYSSNNEFIKSPDYKHMTVCFLFKNDLIKRHNCFFPLNIRTGEDQCFILKCLAHVHFIVTIPEAHYYYVDNPNSAVNTHTTLADTEDALKVALLFSEYCRDEHIEQDCFKSNAVMSLLYIYLYHLFYRHFSFSTIAQKTYRYYYKNILKVQPTMSFDYKLKIAYVSITFYSFYLFLAHLKSALLKCI